MRLSSLLFIFLCLLMTAACGDDTVQKNLDRVDSMLEPDPAAASLLLDSISPRSTADSARHALYRLVTIGKLTGIVGNDSLLSIVNRFYTGYDPDHPTRDEMIAVMYRARSLTGNEEKSQSLKLLKTAERMAELLCDTIYMSRIYAQIGYLYSTDYNEPMYIEYSAKALELSRKKQTDFLVYDIFRLAHAYNTVDRDSLALPLYNEALQMARERKETVLTGLILSEYAMSASSYGDNSTALKLCREIDSINALSAETTALLAWLLNENGERNLSEIYIKRAIQESESENLEFKFSPFFYSYLINKRNHQPEKALADLEVYYSQSHVVTHRRLQQQTGRAHLDYYRDYSTALQLQFRLRKRIELLSVLLILIILFFIFFLLRWQRRKKRYEYAILSASLSTAYTELDLLKQKLASSLEEMKKAKDESTNANNTATNLEKGIGLFASLSSANLELCNLLLKESSTQTSRTQNQLKRSSDRIMEIAGKLFDRQHGEILYRWIDSTCDGLITHIREEWPNVSDKALRIIALNVLGMSNPSIMMLLGGTYHSIAQYKVRIRETLLRPEMPHYLLYKEYLG